MHSRSRSLRIQDVIVDIHECVCLVELGTDNVSCSVDPTILPSSFLEVMQLMTRVENWREEWKKNKTKRT
jgi:hypothetical protein